MTEWNLHELDDYRSRSLDEMLNVLSLTRNRFSSEIYGCVCLERRHFPVEQCKYEWFCSWTAYEIICQPMIDAVVVTRTTLAAVWAMPFLIDISISTGKSLSIRNSCYWCLFDLQLRQSSNQIFTYWTFDAVGEQRKVSDVKCESSFRDENFDKQILFVIFAGIAIRQTLCL